MSGNGGPNVAGGGNSQGDAGEWDSLRNLNDNTLAEQRPEQKPMYTREQLGEMSPEELEAIIKKMKAGADSANAAPAGANSSTTFDEIVPISPLPSAIGGDTVVNSPASPAETMLQEQEREKAKEKAKGSSAFRRVVTGACVVALGAIVLLGNASTLDKFGKKNEKMDEAFDAARRGVYEQQLNTAELKNGVSYNYDDYSKFDEKSSRNAYGTDKSYCFENDALMDAEFKNKAKEMPEALASYAKLAFTNEEQRDLGIDNMTAKQLEDFMSNSENAEAGKLQERITQKLNNIVDDKENTKWEYYRENDTENTYYVIWNDANNDGLITPAEAHLGYSRSARRGAPQADMYRKDKNGNWVKVLDINLYCGLQPNIEDSSVTGDLEYISGEEEDHSGDKSTTSGGGDGKNAAAINRNMQTGDETNNRVSPRGAGDLSDRPDTSENSYEQEKKLKEEKEKAALNKQSGSSNGGTVEDQIRNADQGQSGHQNLTKEQEAQRKQQEQAKKLQDEAIKKQKALEEEAKRKAQMNNTEAANWFNNLTK